MPEIVSASVGNFANPADPEFEDFGEMLLRSDRGQRLYPASIGTRRTGWPTGATGG